MRNSDLFLLARKNLKGKWTILPVIGFAIAAFCLCFAGAILTIMQEEKAQPYEIIISAQGTSLTDENIAEIEKIEDVTEASLVLQIPVRILADEYTTQLTLTGIDAEYLKEGFSQGETYPDNSVMPYIVLNEAACKQFSTEEDGADADAQDKEMPEIDWLNQSFIVQLGEGIKDVTSKVCGILSTNEDEAEYEEPSAYISIYAAMALLQQSGQNDDYTAIHVRVKNIGCADDVSKAIANLGMAVSNSTEELQAGWDADTKEMTYLIVIGVFSLICASFLLAAWKTVSSLRQKDAWEAMRCLGMQELHIRKMYVFQSMLLSLVGTAIGVLTAIVLPSFLLAKSVETNVIEETNYMLSTPLEIVAFSVIICILASIVPIWSIRREKGSRYGR